MLEIMRAVVALFSRRWREEKVMEPDTRSWILAPAAFRRVIEERTRERFGMSLSEFADAFRAGKLDDDPAAIELAVVSGASSRRD